MKNEFYIPFRLQTVMTSDMHLLLNGMILMQPSFVDTNFCIMLKIALLRWYVVDIKNLYPSLYPIGSLSSTVSIFKCCH